MRIKHHKRKLMGTCSDEGEEMQFERFHQFYFKKGINKNQSANLFIQSVNLFTS